MSSRPQCPLPSPPVSGGRVLHAGPFQLVHAGLKVELKKL